MSSATKRMADTLRGPASAVLETAETAREQLRTMGEGAHEAAHDAMDQARDSAAELYSEGRDRVRGATASVEQCIRDQPLRSLLVAAGIGCLLAHYGFAANSCMSHAGSTWQSETAAGSRFRGIPEGDPAVVF